MAEGNLFLNISFDYEKLANNVIKHLTQDQIKQACIDSISIDPIKTEHYEEEIEEDEYKEWPDDIDWSKGQIASQPHRQDPNSQDYLFEVSRETFFDLWSELKNNGWVIESHTKEFLFDDSLVNFSIEIEQIGGYFPDSFVINQGDKIVEITDEQVTIIRRYMNERVTYDKDLS